MCSVPALCTSVLPHAVFLDLPPSFLILGRDEGKIAGEGVTGSLGVGWVIGGAMSRKASESSYGTAKIRVVRLSHDARVVASVGCMYDGDRSVDSRALAQVWRFVT